MSDKTLLIELGTEELPPKSLKSLGESFAKSIFNTLSEAEITRTESTLTWHAAPRRLAVSISMISAQQPDQQIERKGPAVQAAFKANGKPTPAAIGFAKSCGVELTQLERLKTDKGEWLYYKKQEPGKPADQIIQDAIETANKQLPIAKRMRWGDNTAEFVRPVHWLVALLDKQIIPVSILGLQASNKSQGHRFHGRGEIMINHADDYVSAMEEAHVICNFEQRQQRIKNQISELAASVNGNIQENQNLLDEVTALVEFPYAVIGKIDQRFMDVPSESLISSMRDHQKYFHIVDADNKLMPYFITVSNIESKDIQRVISGNERVLRARLSDAEFFWQTDQKTPLESRLSALENVLYHVKLGSVANKASRLEKTAGALAEKLNADPQLASRAAKLAKADLVSDMVGEFADLQGIMGRYYANKDNEDPLIGDCIEQHYWPKFAGDRLPETATAQAVSLADKLDSLVGIFGAGEIPTGDKDPYALRRAALGILRILIEKQQALNLSEIVNIAANAYIDQGIEISDDIQQAVVKFMNERYKPLYQSQGIETNQINAVLACPTDNPVDFDNRLKALSEFTALPEAADLTAANKRIRNILKKVDNFKPLEIDAKLFQETAEKSLSDAINKVEAECEQLFNQGEYSDGLKKLATLHKEIDAFFDQVMVMADDKKVKDNRLSLLAQLQKLFLHTADISLL